ncbi:uncharacterized protein LOC133998017 [Scomber scombrus]|uniref:uncharacterized protein LOC133998017 n=1 Tax=Scomber scombrus TaxID=13677 RepID=UPI002DDBB9DE|nr:uncharacterized protein LOC133998017 [Scomber scombrus]
MTDQDKCDRTDWTFIRSRSTPVVALIELGQIGEEAKAKSDRLSVTADCSLVIKKVTVEDAGRYDCRQFDRSGKQQGPDSLVYLSVVSMTEHKDTDEVKLSCSVSIYEWCRYTVKWLYEGRDWDINTNDVQTSQSTCSVTAVLPTSNFIYKSNYKSLQCEVTNINSNEEQLYNFCPQLSGEAETTREPETTAAEKGPDGKGKAPTTKSPTKMTNDKKIESRIITDTDTSMPDTHDDTTGFKESSFSPLWWLLIVVASAAIIVPAVVVAIRRKKATGNNTQMSQGLSLNPAVTQSGLETSQDTYYRNS